MIIGIDYGSKMAGTTAICCLQEGQLYLISSNKNQDADLFIHHFINEQQAPCQLFIDAPLSLPGAYFGQSEDYFYRQADRELKAMSPMFLGGLTARAIKLKDQLSREGHQFFEAYPAAAARRLGLMAHDYKKKTGSIEQVSKIISHDLNLRLAAQPASWHEVDALLAFWVGHQYLIGKVASAGIDDEGVIYY